ncbi:hypothetical protein JR316_0012974 [Psilocybe cubensis]|uniref:Uncharacterized protein n=1 Tax=Psilocybe cubensis TaxID=181762 RepID=A0ACB8GFT3_PSICU|nr:hypothetical protein JR316_0012974 [Psilocybe cubensis]KAH9474513.1 hypothetical protein JR316_0012974 [Psilocybe cubensis]
MGHEMDGDFVTCSIDKFMRCYLPFLPLDNDINRCLDEHLIPDNIITRIVDKAGQESLLFTEFPDTPVIVVGKKNEMQIYSPLADIAKSIGNYSFQVPAGEKPRTRNRFNYRNAYNSTIKSDIEGSNHKNDGCFTSDPDNILSTWGTAVPVEQQVRAKHEDRLDNIEKILSANVQIMNDDVRRMFTYGITFDADEMRLWYHSRSHSAVSVPFNFVKEPLKLVKIFMSFLFATDVELGYDPMVERQEDGHYIFKIPRPKPTESTILPSGDASSSHSASSSLDSVSSSLDNASSSSDDNALSTDSNFPSTDSDSHPIEEQLSVKEQQDAPDDYQYYRTVRVLSCYRSNKISGRMPRVWVIEPYDPVTKKVIPGDQLVLKDVWIEKSAQTERVIQTAIFEDINKFGDCKAPPTTDPALKIIWEQLKDSIQSREYKKLFLTIENDYTGFTSKKPASGSKRIWGLHKPVETSYKSTGTTLRKEAGQSHPIPASTETNIHRPFIPKKQYRIIYKEDFADDSKPWQGKLMDLEYARRFPPQFGDTQEPKTGTPFFMPTEILFERFLHHPLPDRLGISNPYDNNDTEEETLDEARHLVHHFHHDLESLWWLILYLITSHVEDQPAASWPDSNAQAAAINACRIWIRRIFQNTMQLSSERHACFIQSPKKKLVEILPKSVAVHARHIETLRKDLFDSCIVCVRNNRILDHDFYATLHVRSGWFFTTLQGSEQKDWRNYVINPKETTPNAKSLTTSSNPSNAPSDPGIKVGQGDTPAAGSKSLAAIDSVNAKQSGQLKPAGIQSKECLPRPVKMQPLKRGPEKNPNLNQGRSKNDSKRSRHDS